MFIAAVNLRRKAPDHPRGYKAPALVTQCVVGAVASVLAFLIGFVPPSQFSHSSPVLYGLLILAGILVLGVLPPVLLYRFRKPSWKTATGAPAAATAANASVNGGSGDGVAGNGAPAHRPAPVASATADATSTPAPPAAHAAPAVGAPGNGAAGTDANGVSGAAASATASEAPEGVAGGGAGRGHQRLAWGIGALVLVLAVAGVLIYKHGRNDQLARSRADRVIALFAAHHLTVPVDRNTLIDVLGTDGGPVCANPGGALTKALEDLQLSNGAATVGSRPIRGDRRVVAGEQLVLSVYCPQKLPAYEKYVSGKAYYPVIRR